MSWAVAIPAIIGGASAIGGAIADKKASDEALEAQADTNASQINFLKETGQEVENLYTPYSETGERAISDFADFDFDYGDDEFGFDGELDDYLSQSSDFQRNEALDALEQSAVLGGGMNSGSTYKALMDRGQDYAMNDLNNAYSRMNTDKNFAYGQYVDKFNRDRTEIMDNYNKVVTGMNTGLQATGAIGNAKTGNASAVSSLMGTGGDINALRNSNSANTASNVAGVVGDTAGTASALYQNQQNQNNLLNSINASSSANSASGAGAGGNING